MNGSQISLRSLCKHYQRGPFTVKVLDEVDLDIEQGSSVVITGRSGVGKTTLLSLLGGLTRPSSGSVHLDGENLAEMNDATLSDLRARRIGFVFQFASMLPTLTVLENVLLAGVFTKTMDVARARSLLDLVGLHANIDSYPAELSGGQQRRVAIARALMNRPAILLADEPTGDLDVDTEAEILKLLSSINADGTTVILVTHNPNLPEFATQHLRMENGKLQEDGQGIGARL